MSCAVVSSACLSGPRVVPVRIEVDIQPGLPLFTVIGLPDRRIGEAKERVRSAIKNSGFTFPLGKITVNLSPSSVPKQGTGLDLAIAVGVLAASGKCRVPEDGCWVLGELALDGVVRPCQPLLPLLVEALDHGIPGVIIPAVNSDEVAQVPECATFTAASLQELAGKLSKRLFWKPGVSLPDLLPTRNEYFIDHIRGQAEAKRCLTIALAGGHHMLMTGPPGTGKTLLARAAGELLPFLTRRQSLDHARISSLVDDHSSIQFEPPFRSPHHTISRAGLLGGGSQGFPGEVSLANDGILFLDEISEISRSVLESLRQPLQDRQVVINRKGGELKYPADCLVIAARNPCPCGLLGVEGQVCRCSAGEMERYERRLSEALLDRFDLFCPVPAESGREVAADGRSMAAEIARCRKVQGRRWGQNMTNGKALLEELEKVVRLDQPSGKMLDEATGRFYLSMRGRQKVLAVALTVADLDRKPRPTIEHLREALSYRYRSSNQRF